MCRLAVAGDHCAAWPPSTGGYHADDEARRCAAEPQHGSSDLVGPAEPTAGRLSVANDARTHRRADGYTVATSRSCSSPTRSDALRVYSRAECARAVAAMSRSITRARGWRRAATTAAARTP